MDSRISQRGLSALLGAILLGLVHAGCARDVNGANPVKPYPNKVILKFNTADSLSQDLYYYFVFNFTAPSSSPDFAPVDQVSGSQRGKNWQEYVMYHPASNGLPEQWVTLKRQPGASLIAGLAGIPSDAAAGQFDSDTFADIVTASPSAGVVQIAHAKSIIDLILPTYYDPPVTVFTGVAPRFVFASDFNGDSHDDILVVDAGSGGPGSVVLLAGQADFSFTPGTALALDGTPVDALLADFDADQQPDLALLEQVGGAYSLVILHNAGAGVFTQASSTPVAAEPVEFATGELSGDANLDIVVGMATAGGTNAVQVYDGNGSGGMAPGEVRSVPGPLKGVAVGEMNGALDDIVVSYGADAATGAVGVFLRSNGSALAPSLTPETTQLLGAQAGYTIVADFGNDNRNDALVLNGDANGGQQLSIVRGERVIDPSSPAVGTFAWNTEPITYKTGLRPTRIKLANLDGGTVPDDLLDVSADPNLPAAGVFLALGKYNFADDDTFWTWKRPEDLNSRPWHLGHEAGPNSLTLSIDPGLFVDLANQPPGLNSGAPPLQTIDPQAGFYVQFMVATLPIEQEDFIGQPPTPTGDEVTDLLSTPVLVPMTPGTTNDEQQTPLAVQHIAPIPSQDINYWAVEVD